MRRMQVMGLMLCGTVAASGILTSQAAGQAPTTGARAEFLGVIGQVESKVVQLGDAMTPAKWDWRPTGARSTCEVLVHMAVDKYLFGASLGLQTPAALAGAAGNQCPADKAQAKVLLVAAFKAFNDAVNAMPESALNDEVTLFGTKTTKRGVLLMTAEHAGEHLGQLIAYARMNNVVPPWSR